MKKQQSGADQYDLISKITDKSTPAKLAKFLRKNGVKGANAAYFRVRPGVPAMLLFDLVRMKKYTVKELQTQLA